MCKKTYIYILFFFLCDRVKLYYEIGATKFEEYKILFKDKKAYVVCDVGANIGYFTLLSASLVGKEGQVHAFEPYSGYYQRLKESWNCNDFPQIKVMPFALSHIVEKHELYKGIRFNYSSG